jgi:hypothetical protein
MRSKNNNFAETRFFAAALYILIGLVHIPFASAQLTASQLPAKAASSIELPNHAPEGFTQVRTDAPKGKLKTITYNSKSIGVDRKAVVSELG